MTKRGEEAGRRKTAGAGQHAPGHGGSRIPPWREPAGMPDPGLRRCILGRLRDAHATVSLGIETLRCCPEVTASPSLRRLLHRLLCQAEEQLRRLEHAFASLREDPGGGDARVAADPVTDMLLLLRHGGRRRIAGWPGPCGRPRWRAPRRPRPCACSPMRPGCTWSPGCST